MRRSTRLTAPGRSAAEGGVGRRLGHGARAVGRGGAAWTLASGVTSVVVSMGAGVHGRCGAGRRGRRIGR